MAPSRLLVVLCLLLLDGGLRSGVAQQPADKPARVSATDALGDPLPEGAVARLGTTRLRPMVGVTQLAFTPDGKSLVSVGVDNSYRLWEAATGKEVRRFRKPGLMAPTLASVVRGRDIIVFNEFRRGGGGPVDSAGPSVAASADGRLLALMDEKTQLSLWDTVTGKHVRRFDFREQEGEKPTRTASAVAFSTDGKILAANILEGSESLIYLWDAASGKELRVLKAGKQRLYNKIVFAPDGKTLLGVRTKEICAWNLASGKRIRFYDDHDEAITAVTFTPDGKQFASASLDKTVRMWSLDSEEEISMLSANAPLTSVAIAPDGRTVAATSDKFVLLWDLTDVKEPRELTGMTTVGSAVAFSRDGRTVVAADVDGRIRLWNLATGKESLPDQQPGPGVALAVLDGGLTLAMGFGNGSVVHTDLTTGKPVRRLPPPAPDLSSLAFSPDGKTRAAPEGSPEDYALRLWSGEKPRELRRLASDEESVSALAFSTDGKYLATSVVAQGRAVLLRMAEPSSIVQLWHTSSGKLYRRLGAGSYARLLAFSADGKFLATITGAHDISLWEIATGNLRLRFRNAVDTAIEGRLMIDARYFGSGAANATCLAFSPDGRWLAVGSADETIRLWDTVSGKLVRAMVGHRSDVTSVVFAPDGAVLASGGEDGTVRLWQVATGLELRRFDGHEGSILSLAFTPDGKRLISSSRDTTVLVWDPTAPGTPQTVPTAEQRTQRLAQLWNDLGSGDGEVAHRAFAELVHMPQDATPFLHDRLKPVSAVPAPLLEQLIGDLDSPSFAARQKAMKQLETLHSQAAAALHKAAVAPKSVEVANRLKQLLNRLDEPLTAPEDLQRFRAVDVLARVSTPDARRLLETLAQGAPGHWLTENARDAVQRLPK